MTVGDGDIIRGVLSITMTNGDVAKNVFTWLVDKVSVGSWTDAATVGYVQSAIEAIFDEVLTMIKGTITFDLVDLYKWTGTEWDYLTTGTPSITPTGAGDVMPAGLAMLMTAYTDLNKVFGRKFLYGVCEAEAIAGFIQTTGVTALAAAAVAYLDAHQSGTMGPLDYLVPGVYSSKATDFVPFNGIAVVKNIFSYQRRRKTGVGV